MLIGAARHLGIPARYVSGHLFRRDGAREQEAAHAWAEAWVGDLGWVAFDPANGVCTDDAYVRVACGLDYRDAAPVAGARSGGGAEELAVEVEVSETLQQSQFQSQS
jgi:transglutaminase-like putative cysteine protease